MAAGLESGFPAPAAGGRTAGPEGMPAAGTPVGLLAAVLDRVLRGVPAGIETRLLDWGTQGWRVDAHHLFHGGVGRDGRVRGFHHRGSAGAAAWARIVEGTRSAPDDLGVYRAVVEVQTGRGWVQATEPSAFFPDDWSRVQVLTAVRQALRGAEVDGTRWTGRTPEGVAVVGTLHADGTARAAPVYEDAA